MPCVINIQQNSVLAYKIRFRPSSGGLKHGLNLVHGFLHRMILKRSFIYTELCYLAVMYSGDWSKRVALKVNH